MGGVQLLILREVISYDTWLWRIRKFYYKFGLQVNKLCHGTRDYMYVLHEKTPKCLINWMVF